MRRLNKPLPPWFLMFGTPCAAVPKHTPCASCPTACGTTSGSGAANRKRLTGMALMADASALSSAARFVRPLEAKKPRGRARLGVRPLHEDQQCVPYQSSMLLSVCYPTLIADISRREAPVEANSEDAGRGSRGFGPIWCRTCPGGLAGLRAAVAVSGLLPCTAHRLRPWRGRRRRSDLPPPSPASGSGCKRSIATHWYGAPWSTWKPRYSISAKLRAEQCSRPRSRLQETG